MTMTVVELKTNKQLRQEEEEDDDEDEEEEEEVSVEGYLVWNEVMG